MGVAINAGRALERLPSWVRWALVLPAAVVGLLACGLTLTLGYRLLLPLGDLHPVFSFFGLKGSRLLTAALNPYVFVRVGARVIPNPHKLHGAVVLAILVVLLLVGSSFVLQALRPDRFYVNWFTLLTGILTIGGASKAVVDVATSPLGRNPELRPLPHATDTQTACPEEI